MGDLNAEALARLLAVLEAQATSNGELATEIRHLAESVEGQGREITTLAAEVDKNTRHTARLVAAHEATRKDRKERRTLLVRAGTAVWGVARSPLGVFLAAFVGWLAATHLATPATVDSSSSPLAIEQAQGATESPQDAPGAPQGDEGAEAPPWSRRTAPEANWEPVGSVQHGADHHPGHPARSDLAGPHQPRRAGPRGSPGPALRSDLHKLP